MKRIMVAVLVITVAPGLMSVAHADLTYMLKGHGETTPAVEDPHHPADSWHRAYLADHKWRRDQFFSDPAEGGDPVISVIRRDEDELTITLNWEKREAYIIKDELFEQLSEMMAQIEQVLKQMPAGTPMPPGVSEFLSATKPEITVQIEGPLAEGTVLDLSCKQYRQVLEVKDQTEGGYWGHTIETSEQWLTEDLELPEADRDAQTWDATRHGAMYRQAFEEAIAGLDMPVGFPVKLHGVTQDLVANTVTVADWEMTSYSEDALDESLFEVPEGFAVQEASVEDAMALPAEGE